MDKDQELAELKRQLTEANTTIGNLLDDQKRESIEQKNYNFVQLYKNHLKSLRRLTNADSNALTVLLIMVEKMNKQNALVISQQNLMKITGKSRSTIVRAVSTLKEHQFVSVIKVGSANAYVVNADVFWRDSNIKKEKFAIFDAAVYATMDEQEPDYIENWKGIKLKPIPVMHDEQMILPDESEE